MQYCSPFNGCPNGETNFPYVPISAPLVGPRSQIVGEGDVTSVSLPDGTLQLYFVPARSFFGNYLPWGVIPLWFIRTVPNLFSAPQPTPQLFGSNQHDNAQSSNAYLFPNKVAESEEKLKFHIQFHNDKATSSTDMHYFTQHLPCGWYPKQCAETQVEKPVKLYELVCCKSCGCKECGRRCAPRGSEMSIDEEKTPNKVHFSANTSAETGCLCENCKTKSNVLKFLPEKLS